MLEVGVDTERVPDHLAAADVGYPRFRLAYRPGNYRVYEYLGGGDAAPAERVK